MSSYFSFEERNLFSIDEYVQLVYQLLKFREELKNRSRVLKRLGHINAEGVVQIKGRAACLIDTADELLVTELMFNGMCSAILFNLSYCHGCLTFSPGPYIHSIARKRLDLSSSMIL